MDEFVNSDQGEEIGIDGSDRDEPKEDDPEATIEETGNMETDDVPLQEQALADPVIEPTTSRHTLYVCNY